MKKRGEGYQGQKSVGSIIVRKGGGRGIGVRGVVVIVEGTRGRDTEEGPQREGEARELLKREAEEKVKKLMAGEAIWIACNALPSIRR